MTLSPLPGPTQALLQRLDDMYAGIDPDDIDAGKAIWRALLDELIDDTEAQEQGDEAA